MKPRASDSDLTMDPSLLIKLRPATNDDVRDMTIIKLSNSNGFSAILTGVDESGDLSETVIKEHEDDVRNRLAASNGVLTVATVRTAGSATEIIAGWAMWKVFDDPQPSEGNAVTPLQREADSDQQTKLSKRCLFDFKEGLVKGRNTYSAGRRNIRLCNLFTHPANHRRGVGSRLIQEGIDLADEKGYPAFLEASPMGKALYEKHGFEELDSFSLDLDSYRLDRRGQKDLYTTSFMVREPGD